MNFSALSSFSGTLLWAYAGGGILFLLIGLSLRRGFFLRRPLQGMALASLRSEAEYWQVPEAALVDFVYSQRRFTSWLAIGGGLGSLFFAVISALLLMSPLWSLICPFDFGNFIINIWLLACIIGGSYGGYYAIGSLRREARTMRAGGPQRHLHDYRSPLFFLISCAWFVLSFTSVLAFHPSYLPINRCIHNNFFARLVPWQGWIVYPWLGLVFVALLSLELLLSRCASARSPLVPTNISGADGIDDMFRGKIINIVQYVIIAQISFFCSGLPALISDSYPIVIVIIPVLGLYLGLPLILTSGGLGGRLTGWFWKRKRAA